MIAIKAISIDNFAFNAPRPKNTSLSVLKAKNMFMSLPSVEDEIHTLCSKIEVV